MTMRIAAAMLCLLPSLLLPSSARAADATGQVNFFLGQKSLDSKDWEPVDRQAEFGAVMSFGRKDWPVFIAADVMGSADDATMQDPVLGSVDVTGATLELDFGVRKVFGKQRTHPYVAGGIGAISATAELKSGGVKVDADDSALGFWLDGGVFWTLGTRFNIGLDVRWSEAKIDLDFGNGVVAKDIDAGGLQYGLLLGFGW